MSPALVSRYVEAAVQKDLKKKMVFLAGPRQSGKTTVSLKILKTLGGQYFNWDDAEDRETIMKSQWPLGQKLLVFDEIHKYSRWRNTLKGLFDKHREQYKIMVTGSAKLDHYRRGGDSLQGRYFLHHLFPLSFAEIRAKTHSDLEQMLRLGPFPEPFFSGSEQEAKRWSREYRSRIVREELVSLETVEEVDVIEELLLRLPDLVGSGLSVNALREDLNVSHDSVSRWLSMLENLYAIFRIYPMRSERIKALKKEPKHYHYDWIRIENEGARFENLIAFHLLKWCIYQEDTTGEDFTLSYYRDKEKREVDFVILKNRRPLHLIEAKVSETQISGGLKYLKAKFPEAKATQVVFQPNKEYVNHEKIEVVRAETFLAALI
jgi:uncharacterized protein